MSQWTISRKIAAGFLVILLQGLVLGGYALWKSAAALDNLNVVTSRYVPESELAASVERELLNARIHFIYFVTVQKPGSLEKGRERFRNAKEQLPKLLAVIDGVDAFASIRGDAAGLRQAIDAYEPILERIISVVQAKKNEGPEFTALLNQWASLGGSMVDSAGRLHRRGVDATYEWAKATVAGGATLVLC